MGQTVSRGILALTIALGGSVIEGSRPGGKELPSNGGVVHALRHEGSRSLASRKPDVVAITTEFGTYLCAVGRKWGMYYPSGVGPMSNVDCGADFDQTQSKVSSITLNGKEYAPASCFIPNRPGAHCKPQS